MILKHFVKYYNQHDIDEEVAPGWGTKCCGIACLAMVIYRNKKAKIPLNDLLKKGLEMGAYSERGWIHNKLLDMATEYGVCGEARSIESNFKNFCSTLQGGSVIIASVAHQFPVDGRKGGHLVLVNGYQCSEKPALYVNDPSRWGRSLRRISFERFAKSFSGRIITLHDAQ